jgi:hypothetical protein
LLPSEHVGNGKVLAGVGPVEEKANTGIYIISDDTMDILYFTLKKVVLSS